MAVFFFFFRGIGKGRVVHQLTGGKLNLLKHLSSQSQVSLFFPIVTVCVVGEDGGQAGLFGC